MGSIVSKEWCVVWWLETSTSTGASTSGTPASELCQRELRPQELENGPGPVLSSVEPSPVSV